MAEEVDLADITQNRGEEDVDDREVGASDQSRLSSRH